MNIDFEYLKQLLQEYNTLKESFRYYDPDENDYDEITYLTQKNTVKQGLRNQLICRKQHLTEKHTLRKGTQNYHKVFKKDGKVIRVEHYCKGKISHIHLAYYTADRRYLFPFSSTGGFYPTYGLVTHYQDGIVDEEYQAERIQIVYERYRYQDDGIVLYDYINYVPEGTAPVLSKANGFFRFEPELQYFAESYTTWRDMQLSE